MTVNRRRATEQADEATIGVGGAGQGSVPGARHGRADVRNLGKVVPPPGLPRDEHAEGTLAALRRNPAPTWLGGGEEEPAAASPHGWPVSPEVAVSLPPDGRRDGMGGRAARR